jgi:uncharacterized membrane protein YoaK (UPF0700 family)
MRGKIILIFDASINFALGILLLVFSPSIVTMLGIPSALSNVYPNILGAVFIGITIALFYEESRREVGRNASIGMMQE